jgi:hypothetical protein
MELKEKIVLLIYGSIFSGIVIGYFGYFLYSLPAFTEEKLPIWFPAIPLLIIWILAVLK